MVSIIFKHALKKKVQSYEHGVYMGNNDMGRIFIFFKKHDFPKWLKILKDFDKYEYKHISKSYFSRKIYKIILKSYQITQRRTTQLRSIFNN